MPFDPTVFCRHNQIEIATAGTLVFVILECHSLSYDNTHFESHSCLHHAGEFRAANGLVIVLPYYFIVTLLDESTSEAIFAIAVNDVAKS